MAANTKQDQLAAALRGAVPTVSQPEQEQTPAAANEIPPSRSKRTAQTKRQRGKNVHFFLHDEDTRLIRELATWLSGQGERPNDSLVVRAALRAARTDANLLKSYRQATQLDGRLKQHRQ